MNKPILMGAFASPYVRKTRLALAVKGIEHTHENLRPHSDDPVFMQCSPLGKIPAWKDDNVGISDSAVIIQYLDKFYPGPALLPNTAADYARTLWFQEYADSKMVSVIGANLYAEVILAERLFNRAPIQADIDLAINQEIPEILTYLDAQLAGQDYLVANTLTLADLAVGGMLVAMYHCGEVVAADQYPNAAAYVARLFALDVFVQIIQDEVQSFKFLQYDSPLQA